MRYALTVIGVVAILLGLLFFGQGLGLIGGSAMTGELFWAVAGPVIAVAGAALVVVGRRTGRRP